MVSVEFIKSFYISFAGNLQGSIGQYACTRYVSHTSNQTRKAAFQKPAPFLHFDSLLPPRLASARQPRPLDHHHNLSSLSSVEVSSNTGKKGSRDTKPRVLTLANGIYGTSFCLND